MFYLIVALSIFCFSFVLTVGFIRLVREIVFRTLFTTEEIHHHINVCYPKGATPGCKLCVHYGWDDEQV